MPLEGTTIQTGQQGNTEAGQAVTPTAQGPTAPIAGSGGTTSEHETMLGGAPADDTAKPAAGEATAQGAQEHWSKQLPWLKDSPLAQMYTSPEEMLKAHEQMSKTLEGMGSVPAKVEDVKLTLPKGVDPADPGLSYLKQRMVERGIPNSIGQGVMEDYLALNSQIAQGMHDDCVSALSAEWGAQHEARLIQCNKTVAMLDKRLPGFGQYVTTTPAVGSSLHFVRLMDLVGRTMAEDSIPAGPGGTAPRHEMTTKEFISTEVFGGKQE
jgi:hypothetical protein